MNPKNKIIIIGAVGHGNMLSVVKFITNETSSNVEVSPFVSEPVKFKITSENLFNEQKLHQKPFYENKPSKFIDKPKRNFKKR
jgi:hypothetical protein